MKKEASCADAEKAGKKMEENVGGGKAIRRGHGLIPQVERIKNFIF